ncbi:MAG TPA: 2-dehydropantoate 2-reductase [Metalysinibacillus sp.]
MKIAIIGAGAIGKLLATYYAQQHEVIMVVRREEQARAIMNNGITKLTPTRHVNYRVQATTILPKADIYFVTVKFYHLIALQSLLQQVTTTLVFLQNGLAHQSFAKQFSCEVLVGTLTVGAETKNDTTVYERGTGTMQLSAPQNHAIWQLTSEALPIKYVKNVNEVLWQKAILNSLINPLTALLDLPNGELVTNEHAFHLLQTIYTELIHAFPDKKHLVGIEDVVQLCHNTAMNTSSMRADFLAGRPSELETIVGAILEEAVNRQQLLPTLHTLYYALLAIEERRASE